MARRIAASVVALIALLLGVVAVPLGLITAAHDRQVFRSATISAATSLANVTEEKIADHSGGPALGNNIGQLRRAGDRVSVYSQAGRRSAGGPRKAPGPTMSCHTAVRFALDQCSGFQIGTTVWKNEFSVPPATASIA